MNRRTRPRIVAANWKMHKTVEEVGSYFEGFRAVSPAPREGVRLLFFPSFPLLVPVVEAVAERGDIGVGAQNCHWEEEGAYTGEVSAPMIAATGASHVLVGHSERRQYFGETDATCAKKLRAVLDAGLAPMLCVGERLEEREAGRARTVVIEQLTRAADGLSREEYRNLSLAYEPVWAIGTGETAEPADAQEMHAAIRDVLGSIASPELAREIPILYGGSCKPHNAEALISQPDVDGSLVGGASLDPSDFAAIAAAATA